MKLAVLPTNRSTPRIPGLLSCGSSAFATRRKRSSKRRSRRKISEKNPFKGKPIHLEDNPFDRGLGMAHRMLKNSGHTLPWIETKREIIQERKAIDQAIEQHLAWLGDRIQRLKQAAASEKQLRRLEADHDRFLAYLHDRVAKLRQTIERYNLEVPLFDQTGRPTSGRKRTSRGSRKARPLLAEVGIARRRGPAGVLRLLRWGSNKKSPAP